MALLEKFLKAKKKKKADMDERESIKKFGDVRNATDAELEKLRRTRKPEDREAFAKAVKKFRKKK